MTTRKYTSRSQQTTLTSAVTSGALTFPVVSATTLLGGATVSTGQTFTIVVDPDTALEEVVDVTVVSGNNLTVTRAIDGSGAQDHSSGAVIRHMIIGRDLREANTHIEATNGVHGLASTSAVVGTQDTQTLYNKTLVAPILTSTVENDAGISFQGTTVDAYSTTLTVVDPTANRTITLPNTSGTVDIIDAVQTLTNKTLTTATLGSNLAAGGYKITGLGTPTASTDAVTKTYADANVAAAATSAASAATSASSAQTSASSAATSANSAATSASSAAAYTSAAATSASSAATSASSAATSASSAAASASSMSASVAAAATSATSAAASATAASTSATSAAASATTASGYVSTVAASAAAASTSAASASTSASSAATSANSAATSASSAAAYTSAAATSASSAATSASSAATSASSSLATYNTYKTYYLGSFASAPTLDNQGNALITGATYFNSGSNVMYVYTSSTWNPISSATSYSAPTLGSTTIASGTTYTNVAGLTINSTTIPTSATLTKTSDNLSVFAATTSAQLSGVISDETGSGSLVFATAPTLSGALVAADPTVALGVASKQYVDAVTAAINFHAPVKLATTANIAGTYNNGSSSGIGATFTTTATGRLSIDSVNVTNGDRVLLKNQTTDLQNGIYVVTVQGAGGTSAVLTRATDYDTSVEITNGDVIFTTAGTVNTGVTFVNSMAAGTTVVGTSSITFSTYTSASLPTQTGQAGNYLTTDGTTPSWGTITAGSQVKIDSGTGATYTYIDFLGMGTDTGTAGTVKVQPLTNTGSNTGKRVYSGSTTPSSPTTGDVWIDTTSSTDPDLRTMTLMGAY
jgi:hypothetical protein